MEISLMIMRDPQIGVKKNIKENEEINVILNLDCTQMQIIEQNIGMRQKV